MARPLGISDQDVRRLIEQEGLLPKEIAKKLRVGLTSVYRSMDRLGIERRQYVRHEYPWKILPEHHESLVRRYLDSLDTAAKTGGKNQDAEYLHQAFRWANDLIRRGRDLGYSPTYAGKELADQGGFYEMPEPEGGGFVRKLRDAALAAGRREQQEAQT
jgi:hypothetical protein